MNSFGKQERIVSRKLIEQMFTGRHQSAVAYPLRMVYTTVGKAPDASPAMQILVSVSKRRLRHAVDRNRVKRLIREAYRCNKQIMAESHAVADTESPVRSIAMAFVWLADDVKPYCAVEQSVRKLLIQAADRLYNERNIENTQ